jgi:hypothetical protein
VGAATGADVRSRSGDDGWRGSLRYSASHARVPSMCQAPGKISRPAHPTLQASVATTNNRLQRFLGEPKQQLVTP